MDLTEPRLGNLVLPGRAGELQGQKATASLVRELGDNYPVYHSFLADRLAELGRPNPEDYKTFEAFAAAWALREEVVHAEVTLRKCRGFRLEGERLDAPPKSPLIDEDDQLVSVER